MKCSMCAGSKALHLGNGVRITCPACRGKATTTATIAEREAAKRTIAAAPTVLRFSVDGVPRPKGRPRFAVMKRKGTGAAFVRTYTPEETAAYEAKIRTCAQFAVNQAGWMWASDDRFNVVLRVFRPHFDQGGDLDNVVKLVLDAINGVAFRDDRYVRGIGASLFEDAVRPRLEVEVRKMAAT